MALRGGATVSRTAALLFGSGFAALVYQTCWLRLFRHVFGSSTPATAAVIAIFMGGLGVGALWIGSRADRAANPLRLYAKLELSVAALAAISPWLIDGVATLYVAAGGTQRFGFVGGSGLRLLLAAVVLAAPTLLMGGSLPAAIRAGEAAGDLGRRRTGLLYGVNTVGAVAGVLVTTFVALERLGVHGALWSACLLNAIVGALAWWASSGGERESRSTAAVAPADASSGHGFVYLAAGLVGFTFFLLELVWYRMLAPILGGSSYTFGLILATALAGIGVGGLLYGRGRDERRPTLTGFALTCALEAVFVLIPLALGDRMALLAGRVAGLADSGFFALAAGWLLVTALVVFPAACIAGYQFPLLVALLGRGRRAVGRDVGRAYAANTLGAFLGSIAGGFGALPALGAVGSWRLAGVVLVALSLAALLLSRRERVGWREATVGVLALAALAATLAPGPTAFWRHMGIGVGWQQTTYADANERQADLNRSRWALLWEADGRESGVGVLRETALDLIVNGKSDGNVRFDGSTTTMLSMVPATLHPDPKRALVIGVGTGVTAGWLTRLDSIERVDVVELEPAVDRLVRECGPANYDLLDSPKVELIHGDGREVLATLDRRYDLIVSEPSNPYRAGIASLFTREFYELARRRLAPGGLFGQWVQAYDIRQTTFDAILATMGGTFDAVETWEVGRGFDLLLVGWTSPPHYDADRLSRRVAASPMREALALTWGVEGLGGFLSGYLASDAFTRSTAAATPRVNTDDRTRIEFDFARSIGRVRGSIVEGLRESSSRAGQDRPPIGVDVDDVRAEALAVRSVYENATLDASWVEGASEPTTAARHAARRAYVDGDFESAHRHWWAQLAAPSTPFDRLMVAELAARVGDPSAASWIETVAAERPAEAGALTAWSRFDEGDEGGAVAALEAAYLAARREPWLHWPSIGRSFVLAEELARRDADAGRRLHAALDAPFAVRNLDRARTRAALSVALAADRDGLCESAFARFEPHVPWERELLEERVRCYERRGSPRLPSARAALRRYDRQAETTAGGS